MPAIHKDIFAELSPRLRYAVNPYAKIMKENQDSRVLPMCYGPPLKAMKGRWLEYFAEQHLASFENQGSRQLVLEIGCHNGKTISHLAKQHPNRCFVGMDITFKRVVTTARLGQEHGLKNLFAVLGDARQVESVFAPGELDMVIAFFPDPWQKKRRQIDKRLFNSDYFAVLARVLKPKGQFWFRTDSRDYFDQVTRVISEIGFVASDQDSPMSTHGVESSFEAFFKKQKQATFEGLWLNP